VKQVTKEKNINENAFGVEKQRFISKWSKNGV